MDPEFPCVTSVRVAADTSANWTYEEAFVTEITGAVRGMVSETEEEEFGTITVLKVSACEACNRRFSLADICDSHSEFLFSIFATIFDASTEDTKEELEIEPGWIDLLVLWELNLKPEYRTHSIVTRAFQAAMNLLGPRDLIVAAMDGVHFIGLDLTKAEWKELGFVRIIGSQFVFRDTAYLNRYRDKGQTNQ